MKFSPYELRILLDVYSGAPISANQSAERYVPTIDDFCQREYIRRESSDPGDISVYLPTEKLNVLMYHILTTPDPVWQMPER